MRHIYLLDCTLRDGGYVNNWEFGKECIQKFPIELCEANIDILELGFIRNEAVNHDRTVFTSADDLGRFKHILSARPEGMAYGVPSGYIQRVHRMPHLSDGQLRDNFNYQNVIYSAMIEGNEKEKTFPVHKLGTPQETGIALIRICTWKRLMEEHLEYCRSVSDLGYQVSIQPTAIDQYDDETFIKLLKLTNHVMPFSFYLVDTWGTQSPRQIVHYAQLVNEYLDPTIKLGYHG
ncbi:MAG: hypothetical protein HFI76_03055, partial [Lachnospiraceae bacterium]|nr:hypothetical protein [Lachnospiraceae bacterium]